MRLPTRQRGEHHLTIPNYAPLRVGTLAGILDAVAAHFEVSRTELLRQIFGG